MNFIKTLINTPNGVVLTSTWLKRQGFSKDLLKVYRKNGSIFSIARGAFLKVNDVPTIEGAIYALQRDGYDLHVGGRSALSRYHNIWQYLRKYKTVELYPTTKKTLPQWFKSVFHNDYEFLNAHFLLTDDGIEKQSTGYGFDIDVSCQERAFLELLYGCPERTSVQEAYELLELMPSMRPKLLQKLLENCSSIKVKRLFLYLVSVLKPDWADRIDVSQINLGTSVYKIEADGQYNKKFQIIIKEVKNV